MAARGSSKDRSVRQEEYVASRFPSAKRSPSSGAAVSDQGDVRNHQYLIECKVRGQYDKPAKSISISMEDLAKITDEAWSEGKEPLMALRIIADPAHPLADRDGHIDLIVTTLDHFMDPRYA